MPAPRIVALSALSIALNVVLLLHGAAREPLGGRKLEAAKGSPPMQATAGTLPPLPQWQEATPLGGALGRLTDMVIPLHAKEEDVVVDQMMESWREHPPCDASSQGDRPIALTFFASSFPNRGLERRLLDAFYNLPMSARGCLRGPTVKFGSIIEEDNAYYRTGENRLFELFLNGWLGLREPQYVLYLTPGTLPLCPGWLSVSIAAACPPNALPFWVKGSAPLGADGKYHRTVAPLHLDRMAIYNLHDAAFATLFDSTIRPYLVRLDGAPPSAHDLGIFQYLLDRDNFKIARDIAHLFQHTGLFAIHTAPLVGPAEAPPEHRSAVLLHHEPLPAPP